MDSTRTGHYHFFAKPLKGTGKALIATRWRGIGRRGGAVTLKEQEIWFGDKMINDPAPFSEICCMLLPYLNIHETEAGCDEAGRGCLAGPVFAAAVVLPKKFKHPFLNDSKQLTEKQRDDLRTIIEREALSWSVVKLEPVEIDELNILWASIEGMHRAVRQLKLMPTSLLVDGNRFKPFPNIPHHCIIKGDGKYLSIAAASILAKTHRDEYMTVLAKQYPEYGWEKNKGYPTKVHRDAIRLYGATTHHRRSFRLLPEIEQGTLF